MIRTLISWLFNPTFGGRSISNFIFTLIAHGCSI
jgi:hypothetical protein